MRRSEDPAKYARISMGMCPTGMLALLVRLVMGYVRAGKRPRRKG